MISLKQDHPFNFSLQRKEIDGFVDEEIEKFISDYEFYSDEILPNEEEAFMLIFNEYNMKLKEK